MHAVGLRWNNVRRMPVVRAVIVGGWVTIGLSVRFFDLIEHAAASLWMPVPLFVGLVTLACAVVLHYDTLTRRNATYRLPHVAYDSFAPGMP